MNYLKINWDEDKEIIVPSKQVTDDIVNNFKTNVETILSDGVQKIRIGTGTGFWR